MIDNSPAVNEAILKLLSINAQLLAEIYDSTVKSDEKAVDEVAEHLKAIFDTLKPRDDELSKQPK